MRKFFVSFLILGVLIITAQLIWAQLPKVVTTDYSEDGYFAQKALLSGGSMEDTITEAKKELAQQMFRNLNSMFNPRQKQAKHKWMRAEEAYGPALYNLENMSKRPADAHLVKLFMTTKPQPTDSNRYVYVNVKHQEMMEAYVERENALKRQINSLVASAAQTEAVDPDQALLTYLKATPLYEQLKEAVLIQQMAKPQQNQDSAKILSKLMETATGTSGGTLEMSQPDLTQRINQLQNQGRLMNSMQEITNSIAYQLSIQAKGLKRGKVLVHPFTNGRSPNPIRAENFYLQLFERLRADKWNPEYVERGMIPETVSFSLQGKIYGGNGAAVRIGATVHNLNTSETVAKSDLNVNPNLEFTFKTENSDALQQHDDAWDSAPADTAPSEGLQLAAWTDNPTGIYRSGDRMTVSCRVNQPAYVRLLYVLDDAGTGGLKYTLLHDSTHIDSTQVGTDVTIGRFVATPPFGSEELIVLAREEPFPEVTTIDKGDGYRYLKAKSVEEAVAMMTVSTTRGMQAMPINERIGIVTKASAE